MRLFLLVILIAAPWSALAYPDFIGYGYTSCTTCHFNSQGNGPLTDYGRALFSNEIAARNFWTPKTVSDEEIAERSGFIPGVALPRWLRPSIKYRGLHVHTNPGSAQTRQRWIHMQRDINLTLPFDQAQRTIVTLNYGLLPMPGTDYYGTGNKVDWASREHYLRTYLGQKLIVAAGLMDIAFGLRTSDHTAYNRSRIGLGQNDQSHSLLFHWLEENWEVSLQMFAGNLQKRTEAQSPGASVMFEYTTHTNNRLGASFMTFKNSQSEGKRLAIHDRWGIPDMHGSSIIAEVGLNEDKVGDQEAKLGNYALIQSVIQLTRGYNILSVIERMQAESKYSSPEIQRWTFGFLLFPLQRTEVRLTSVMYKSYSPEAAAEDQSQLQGQLHVSW